MLTFLKVFIAWLNLDLELKLAVKGLNSYTKTWLQFIFPLYTAGIFLLV